MTNGYSSNGKNTVRIGVPTSSHIGIDPKTKTGPLMDFLGYSTSCGISIGEAVKRGEYEFTEEEPVTLKVVYGPAANIPQRTHLDGGYDEGMEIGATGRDHWADWADISHVDSLVPVRFKAALKRKGIVPVADLGFNPVYHVIAKPKSMEGDPLKSGKLIISAEYPNRVINWAEHQYAGIPITYKVVNLRTNETREFSNKVSGRDRMEITVFVTTGKTEYANGIIADTTQTGNSLETMKYEPLVVIGESSPLVAANVRVANERPDIVERMAQIGRNAREYWEERKPELFKREFVMRYPELVRDFRGTVVALNSGNPANWEGELFFDEAPPTPSESGDGRHGIWPFRRQEVRQL